MKKKKIAFIHYPHYANNARLETMPFALNSVINLAKMGWNVDLYLWEKPSLNYKDLLPDTVTLKYFIDPKLSPQGRRSQLRAILLPFQFQWRNNYCCVFGLGQIGAYIANIIAKSNKCPFIYYNDEFPSEWGKNYWTSLEQKAVKQAAMIVLPDPHRFHILSKELGISTKPYSYLPNIPKIQLPLEKIDWHEKLDIPKDCIPFLHAGSIANWAQVPEILCSIPYWHERAVLLLHGRTREEIEKYRKEVSHLDVPGKVIWNYEPIPENQLNSLVSYCAGNFALYRNTGPNIEYMGYSSGKLMRSLACGSPIIASTLSSFSFIKDYQLGVLVNHSSEIPAAVEVILHDRKTYSKNCLEFSTKNVSFDSNWHIFCEQFEKTVNIDLSRPLS